jgi:membrane protein DedA with SNARE-associated domain
MIAVSVVVENFFPPSPSDVFVVLAAFLAHRGTTDPLSIFLVAWGFGVAGAIAVYVGARSFGRRFLETRFGRRLITPGTFAALEREYLRFGVAGMFFFRLLPAFRSVVAPFAGFVNLPPRRALPPIVLACGLWYAGLILLGGAVGSEWTRIQTLLSRLNEGLGLVAGIVFILLVVWFVLRRRATRRVRLAELAPFDPLHPEQPAPMLHGLPVISADALEQARLARRDASPDR